MLQESGSDIGELPKGGATKSSVNEILKFARWFTCFRHPREKRRIWVFLLEALGLFYTPEIMPRHLQSSPDL